MYESPIYIYTKELQSKLEDNILTAVHSYGISVDRDELIKALRYDRFQYDYGYADGFRNANDKIVRCKDCIHCVLTNDGKYNPGDIVCDYFMTDGMNADDFCSYGVRKEEKNE